MGAKTWEGRLWRIKARDLNDRKIVRMSVMTILNPAAGLKAATAPCRAYIGSIGFHVGSPPKPPIISEISCSPASSHSIIMAPEDRSATYLRTSVHWHWIDDANFVQCGAQLTRCVDIYCKNEGRLVYLGRGMGQALQIS